MPAAIAVPHFRGPVDLPDRQWPSRRITQAPRWVSTDLRDGNQALANPMNVEQKMRFYRMLLDIGFNEIEIGFPSASETEFDFVRSLIDGDLIPDDVTVQVLTQSRNDLIVRTFQSLAGARQAIVPRRRAASRATTGKVAPQQRTSS